MPGIGERGGFNGEQSNLRPAYWKRAWCWGRLKSGGEGDDRGWDGWMASPIQWTWVWASSWRWWRTGKAGVLQSIGSQRVGHNYCDWTTTKQIYVSHMASCTPGEQLSLSLPPASVGNSTLAISDLYPAVWCSSPIAANSDIMSSSRIQLCLNLETDS